MLMVLIFYIKIENLKIKTAGVMLLHVHFEPTVSAASDGLADRT
jgi:hypothetical protein